MRESLKDRLKRKLISIAAVASGATVLTIALCFIFITVYILLPSAVQESLRSAALYSIKDPDIIGEWLRQKGKDSHWLFIGAQIVQVFFAPLPGQAAALAGGYVFGFWKGWGLTTVGQLLGSSLAMFAARMLGERAVRKFVPESLATNFDILISNGGYAQFFIIFLLPALPDDAVCFIAGLTRLRLLPLILICIAGRAPGMAVLSLLGSQAATGPVWWVKLLFAALMLLSTVFWLFDDIIYNKLEKK